jgi:putative addiction module CopG family antidote
MVRAGSRSPSQNIVETRRNPSLLAPASPPEAKRAERSHSGEEVEAMANVGRNLRLTDELGSFVDEQVKSGRHVNSSEVVCEALPRYQDDIRREQGHLNYLQKLADRGETNIIAGRYVELTTPNDLRAHIRNRAARRSRTAE